MPRPLIDDQAALVSEIGVVQSTPGHLVRVLAVLKCPKCRRSSVGDVRSLALPDGPDHVRLWRGGPIVTGTLPRDRDDLRAVTAALDLRDGPGRRRLPGDVQYTALLDQPGLPAALPFWCSHHGLLTYSVRDLRAIAAEVSAGDQSAKVVRVNG